MLAWRFAVILSWFYLNCCTSHCWLSRNHDNNERSLAKPQSMTSWCYIRIQIQILYLTTKPAKFHDQSERSNQLCRSWKPAKCQRKSETLVGSDLFDLTIGRHLAGISVKCRDIWIDVRGIAARTAHRFQALWKYHHWQCNVFKPLQAYEPLQAS